MGIHRRLPSSRAGEAQILSVLTRGSTSRSTSTGPELRVCPPLARGAWGWEKTAPPDHRGVRSQDPLPAPCGASCSWAARQDPLQQNGDVFVHAARTFSWAVSSPRDAGVPSCPGSGWLLSPASRFHLMAAGHQIKLGPTVTSMGLPGTPSERNGRKQVT